MSQINYCNVDKRNANMLKLGGRSLRIVICGITIIKRKYVFASKAFIIYIDI